MTKEEQIQELEDKIKILRAEKHRLIGAIRWALGYENFNQPEGPEGKKPFWWRSVLRGLADIPEKKYLYYRKDHIDD